MLIFLVNIWMALKISDLTILCFITGIVSYHKTINWSLPKYFGFSWHIRIAWNILQWDHQNTTSSHYNVWCSSCFWSLYPALLTGESKCTALKTLKIFACVYICMHAQHRTDVFFKKVFVKISEREYTCKRTIWIMTKEKLDQLISSSE